MLSVESEAALDLGCKYCARVYLAIFRRSGTSWLRQMIQDTRMRHETAKRHLGRSRALVALEIAHIIALVSWNNEGFVASQACRSNLRNLA